MQNKKQKQLPNVERSCCPLNESHQAASLLFELYMNVIQTVTTKHNNGNASEGK